ncbi:hypothetical protein U3516DRAFT_737747 [Neocallimastix sp. 'constans']
MSSDMDLLLSIENLDAYNHKNYKQKTQPPFLYRKIYDCETKGLTFKSLGNLKKLQELENVFLTDLITLGLTGFSSKFDDIISSLTNLEKFCFEDLSNLKNWYSVSEINIKFCYKNNKEVEWFQSNSNIGNLLINDKETTTTIKNKTSKENITTKMTTKKNSTTKKITTKKTTTNEKTTTTKKTTTTIKNKTSKENITTKMTTKKNSTTKKITTKKTTTNEKTTTTKKATTIKKITTTTKKSTTSKNSSPTSSKGQCCSKYGYCGTISDYCDNGCQTLYDSFGYLVSQRYKNLYIPTTLNVRVHLILLLKLIEYSPL